MIDLVKEDIVKYNAKNISELDLISVFIGENIVCNLKKAGITCMKDIKATDDKSLLKIEGIGESILIKLRGLEALKGKNDRDEDITTITKPQQLYPLVKHMGDLEQEVVKLFCLNTKNVIISSCELFKGSLDSCVTHPRDVFREALRRNAAGIILVHNHPSGDPNPSYDDLKVTSRIKMSAEILGIDFMDHLIIGKGKFISLKEKGNL